MSLRPSSSRFALLSWLSCLSWFLLAAPPAQALINPDFTPIHLVRQADVILWGRAGAVDEDAGTLTVTITETLKGEGPDALTIDVAGSDPQAAGDLDAELKAGRPEAIVFMGQVGDPAAGGEVAAAIKIGQIWFALEADEEEDGVHVLATDTLDLKAVWAGGSEMLRAATRYILADPRADLPVEVGLTWEEEEKIADLALPIHRMQVVAAGPNGAPWLVVHTAEGSRLFHRPDGEWAELTAGLGFETQATAGVWADFTGDGRLDFLAIEDGALRLHHRPDGGRFQARALALDLPHPALAADAFVPAAGSPAEAVVALAQGTPLRIRNLAGEPQAAALPAPDPAPEGEALAGIRVADLTGDGRQDVVQAYADGVRVWAGQADGGFAVPVFSAATLGTHLVALEVTDFSHDGRLDLLAVSSRGPVTLTNEGEGRFKDRSPEIGEPSYLARPNVKAAVAIDLNHDGREDFLLAYEGLGAHIYFNRAFRTFGYSIELELRDGGLEATERLADGQTGITAGDFTGNGKPEVIMADEEGGLWMLATESLAEPVLSLTVVLPPGRPGPVRVTARDGQFNLGARLVTADRPATFGKQARGPIQLTFPGPDGQERTQPVVVLRPTRFELPAGG